jgi:methylthioribose-1-phosphate isomerase
MKVGGQHYRTIWTDADGAAVRIIDQTLLPHRFTTRRLSTVLEVAEAISTMRVRGAPLIGAAAACGIWLALRADPTDAALERARTLLLATRPTAVNLRWALDEMMAATVPVGPGDRAQAAQARAAAICDEDVETCRRIGMHGAALIAAAARGKNGGPVNVLTHCNAGWLATVDWGTALSAVYQAHEADIAVHVWVDETRPRNQGAALTAFELGAHGVPHTIIADNAGGLLMQQGRVDLCLVGADRVAANGDVANKIGTYLKALAARDTGIPFYVALPHSTIDWSLPEGVGSIPIEERNPGELTEITGRLPDGTLATVALAPPGSAAANPAFDVTPARLVSSLITERGISAASRAGLLGLYPERAATVRAARSS